MCHKSYISSWRLASAGYRKKGEDMILVVDTKATVAERLKSMIEFMDTPAVVTAAPADWRERTAGERLDAVFLGPDLGENDVADVVDGVGEIDPNASIVIVDKAALA